MTLKATGNSFQEPHKDAGLHLCAALHSLAVMQGGMGKGSKFESAILLRFNSLDLSKFSLLDFLARKEANEARFERDRHCPTAKPSCAAASRAWTLGTALLPITSSLKTDTALWNKFSDVFLLYRFGLMLQIFGEDVRAQKVSSVDETICLVDGKGCAALMKATATKTLEDAKHLCNGWTGNGQFEFFALDQTADGNLKADPPAEPTTTPPTQKELQAAARGKLFCAYNIMHQLKVVDSAGKLAVCTAGTRCPYKHAHDLGELSKANVTSCLHLKFKDGALADNFAKAVTDRPEGSWKVAVDPPEQASEKSKFRGAQESRHLGNRPSCLCRSLHAAGPTRIPSAFKCAHGAALPQGPGGVMSVGLRGVPFSVPRAVELGYNPGCLSSAPQGCEMSAPGSGVGRNALLGPRAVQGVRLPHLVPGPGVATSGDRCADVASEPLAAEVAISPEPPPCAKGLGPDECEDSDEEGDVDTCIPSRNLCVYEALRDRVCGMFPSLCCPSAHLRALALIERAYERYSFESCLDAAVVAIGDFQLDKTALLRDKRDFEACGGDWAELARQRIAARRTQRCNPARVEACISLDNPQRALLLQFAAQGVDVRPLLPPEFVPNGPVVNALLAKGFHAAGLSVIVPLASVTSREGCSLSSSGWAPKPTGPDPVAGAWKPNNGRPTFNPKRMNLPGTKANADAAWGEVHLQKILRKFLTKILIWK
ncbi:hypothetical protein B484DRAFT_401562 [Ochromonadaceae sp. CCMP2298]|nr:hypothetical protein B484DRAFT_401562 [Ochromonadaceae sp. CCMP2298]